MGKRLLLFIYKYATLVSTLSLNNYLRYFSPHLFNYVKFFKLNIQASKKCPHSYKYFQKHNQIKRVHKSRSMVIHFYNKK